MTIQVFSSYEKLSEAAAEHMARTIEAKPNAVISVASGHSPLRTCQRFVEIVKQRNVDVSKTVFVGLDEWLGINPDDQGSGKTFFINNIATPLQIDKTNYHMFDAGETDLTAACTKMDDVIRDLGGIDLMVVGIGINGHIGFNEPGVSFELKSHVIELTETTTQVGQKYFSEAKSLTHGITLGFGHLMNARKVLLLADGEKKKSIVAKAFNGSVSREVPASILSSHVNSIVMLDKVAAEELTLEVDWKG